MKIILNKKYFSEQPEIFLRNRAGYTPISSHHTGKDSFVRHTGRNRYPRFHVYLKYEGERVILDMHLDQKETSYKGSHAHNAEYEGDVVEAEIARVKELILKQVPTEHR